MSTPKTPHKQTNRKHQKAGQEPTISVNDQKFPGEKIVSANQITVIF